MMPRRIQLKRTKGWRKPAGAVVVGRPTKWGNPFRGDPVVSVELYRDHVHRTPDLMRAAPRELGGHDLCCWCPLDQPCHADVLLAIANAEPTP